MLSVNIEAAFDKKKKMKWDKDVEKTEKKIIAAVDVQLTTCKMLYSSVF